MIQLDTEWGQLFETLFKMHGRTVVKGRISSSKYWSMISTVIEYLAHFLPWMESPPFHFSSASFPRLLTSCPVSFPPSSSSSSSMSSHVTLTPVCPSSSSGYPLQSLPLCCVTKVWLSGGTYGGEETLSSSASAKALSALAAGSASGFCF